MGMNNFIHMYVNITVPTKSLFMSKALNQTCTDMVIVVSLLEFISYDQVMGNYT